MTQDQIDVFAKLFSLIEPSMEDATVEVREAYKDAAAVLADIEQKTMGM